ncbi:MAG: peptidylprolyl isomerase [Bacteroidetes bacterium]|jgi:cyclophilin family peptidyl-prolyl cis-trans isomerase|nr:peptidylprolyl isomerase [Bacteroidota bacterium]MBT6685530.1 peptidylprolyl isomerase [Bacteroidota bacterium]MBT7144969.1 peptidylprolyl isomerase [Bacteroidota bacterium]MBT7492481.1 peptidylprolyl isomerase [Bacteroidota bacterium]
MNNIFRNFIFGLLLITAMCSSPAENLERKEISSSKKKEDIEMDEDMALIEKRISEQKAKQYNISSKNVVEFLTKYGQENPETIVQISTEFGNMKLKLYEETPLHRANFLLLAKNKYYDKTIFYRIVENFMIQGGDIDEDYIINKKAFFGQYTIPSEMKDKFYHKRGAIAMARDYNKNPDKRSSFYDFYIVQGEKLSDPKLDAIEDYYKIELDEIRRNTYKKIGGTPHLDGEHTVFGEIIEGIDVIDKIAKVPEDNGDWPINNINIKLTVIE